MGTEFIGSDPWTRVPAPMRAALQSDPDIRFDVHCHFYTFRDVPDEVLGIRIPMNRRVLRWLGGLLRAILPGDGTDRFDRFANYLEMMRSDTALPIVESMFDSYDRHPDRCGGKFIFCPLSMDIRTGTRGSQKRTLLSQLKVMRAVRDRFPERMLPFAAIDPNRRDVYRRIFLRAFSEEFNFFGVKIYPCLGYLPSHPDLMSIFEICEEKNIPVTAHCSGGLIHAAGPCLKNIRGWSLRDGRLEEVADEKFLVLPSQFADYFNHPAKWEPVLYRFPKLRLNLAHFGNASQWEKMDGGGDNLWPRRIVRLMERYEHVFSDVSLTLSKPRILSTLRRVLDENPVAGGRVLFGSDYYNVLAEGDFVEAKRMFGEAMGADLMNKMSRDNPRKFLGLT